MRHRLKRREIGAWHPMTGPGFEVLRTSFPAHARRGPVRLSEAPADGTMWLDTETTGLAAGTGTQVFLIGVAFREGVHVVIEQYLLRRLGAERSMLEVVRDRLGQASVLVTYNGRRFDWPLLEVRFRLQRLSLPWDEPPHLDLLPVARRLWRQPVGTARLTAIEWEVLGHRRDRDIPGGLIPSRYIEFLRSGDDALLEDVVDHNREDVLTLLSLHALADAICDGRSPPVPVDPIGLGLHLERLGRQDRALEAYERALAEECDPGRRWTAVRRLARLYRTRGDGRRLFALWMAEAERAILPAQVSLRRAARVARHVLRDPEAALAVVDRALARAEWDGLRGRMQLSGIATLERMRARLVRSSAGRPRRPADGSSPDKDGVCRS
ncbi:MAG: ribonuclease H-like domain-containing protein [Armatimonadota bacterium]|nr:ribonuclease H-like domain-containing protein [Armatimonadota bacterium]MDR5698168.1 ribonuclease H-like domain-containing protein [Armatimonadota bacterium]